MSYRAPEQELEGPINTILEGMKDFDSAVDARIESGEWKDEHITELARLNLEMRKLRFNLQRLKKRTW